MKHLILLLLALTPFFLKAQYNEWIPGKALTDSSHNNRNACLYGRFDESILFWDQELNSATTQLCYKNLNSASSDVQIALYKPGVKFTNPKIFDLNLFSNSSDIKIVYQTNEGNDIDLKYFTYKLDGTISESLLLASLPGDDINLSSGNSDMVAWENSGKIYVSQYHYESKSFSEPFVIDSAGAFSPVFMSNNYLNYLKPNGDSTTVFSVHIYNTSGSWGVNGATSKSFIGKGSRLSSNGSLFGGGFSAIMENKVGSNPSELVAFNYWLSDIKYQNSPTFNLTQPVIEEYMMHVKSISPHFLAYVSDSLTQNEIFVNTPFGYYPEPLNISQWHGNDQNPKFFVTVHRPEAIRVNLFWESERQGFYTIYNSHYDYLFGSVDEIPNAESIIAKPCSFDQQTTIQFQAPGKISVRILDLQGKEVKKLLPQMDAGGWQNAVWDGTTNYGNSVTSGSYIIVAGTGNKTQSSIIIKK